MLNALLNYNKTIQWYEVDAQVDGRRPHSIDGEPKVEELRSLRGRPIKRVAINYKWPYTRPQQDALILPYLRKNYGYNHYMLVSLFDLQRTSKMLPGGKGIYYRAAGTAVTVLKRIFRQGKC